MDQREPERIDIDPTILIEGLRQYTKKLHEELDGMMHENIKLRAVITQLTGATDGVKGDVEKDA